VDVLEALDDVTGGEKEGGGGTAKLLREAERFDCKGTGVVEVVGDEDICRSLDGEGVRFCRRLLSVVVVVVVGTAPEIDEVVEEEPSMESGEEACFRDCSEDWTPSMLAANGVVKGLTAAKKSKC
jgi:hypothetical protein